MRKPDRVAVAIWLAAAAFAAWTLTR